MVNFNLLQEAQNISQILIHENRESQADYYLNEGLKYFDAFQKSGNKGLLKKAAELFFESIKNKRKQVDSYLWLARTFHILENDKLTIKYIKLAELYDPQNLQVKEFKKMSGLDSIDTEITPNNTAPKNSGSFSQNIKMLISMKMNSVKNKKSDMTLRE